MNQGFPWYLDLVLDQIEVSNGRESFTILLDQYHPGSEKYPVVLMRDYRKTANRFAKVYKHFSSNTYWFELICFQRHMILLDYLKAVNFRDPFLAIDSDCLVYSDLGKINFSSEIQLTKTRDHGPSFMYYRDVGVLQDFCDYMLDYYENHLSEIEEFYQENYVQTGAAGGICDMILLQWYSERVNTAWKDLSIPQDGWCFDHALHMPCGFQKSLLGGKKVRMIQGRPCFFLKKEKISVHALHCQGGYKNIIPLLVSVPVDFKKRLRA